MVQTKEKLQVTRESIKDLRAQLRAAGVFKKPEGRQWVQMCVFLGLFLGITAIQLAFPVWYVVLPLIPLQALVVAPAAMHGHDGAHRALSENNNRNRLMMFIAFPLLAGLSATWWRWKHNGPHHAHPNVVSDDKTDPDIVFWPFATTKEQHDASGPLAKMFQRNVQHWFFWPLTSFVHFRMRGQGVAHAIRHLKNKGAEADVIIDLVLMAVHFTLFLVVPSLFFGFLPVLGVYLLLWGMVSMLLSFIFIPAHVGLPILKGYDDFFSVQLASSRNYRPPRGMRWLFVGLEYQIEHHLFPTIPYRNLPKTAEIVQKWAEDRGLPYRTMSWFEGMADSTRFLSRSWSVPSKDSP